MTEHEQRDESKKVHDWFFQTGAVFALLTVAAVAFGEYAGALLAALATSIAVLGGVYALRRWRRDKP